MTTIYFTHYFKDSALGNTEYSKKNTYPNPGLKHQKFKVLPFLSSFNLTVSFFGLYLLCSSCIYV